MMSNSDVYDSSGSSFLKLKLYLFYLKIIYFILCFLFHFLLSHV